MTKIVERASTDLTFSHTSKTIVDEKISFNVSRRVVRPRMVKKLVAGDFFVVPTLTCRVLFVFARIANLELRPQHGTPSLLLNATTLPRKAGHDGIEGFPWPVLVVQ